MAVTVLIPTPLRNLTGNEETVVVEASSISELIEALEVAHPGIGVRLKTESGALHRFINFYVNEDDIRFLEGLETPLKSGDNVSIVPAIAGGNY
jgi:molybdopterin synthase sulfur carrier subunit